MKKKWIILGVGLAVVVSLLLVIKFKGLAAGSLMSPPSAESTGNFNGELKKAMGLEERGELVKAKEAFENIMQSYASRPGIEDVQKRLEAINMKIVLSAIEVPTQTASYMVNEGDSLAAIAKKFSTTIELIKKENGLSSDVIRPRVPLRIWTGTFSVLVDKSQNLLTLKSNGEIIRTYRVSTGKGNITPVGSFKIVNKLIDPAWSHAGKVVPYGNPENILGTRWLGFDIPTYGLHGTTHPESIGQQVTAGCVRMLNNDVEELYDLLPLGTEVTIVD